jgi:hypothetical protein
MFRSLGDLDALCMEQGEIVDFVKKHRDKLHPNGWATFFLFKVNGEYFVAGVRVDGRRLGAIVHRFDYSDVWGAAYRRRVVVPQRAALKP